MLKLERAANLLLLGGTGFIGKHICTSLERWGIPATTISRSPDRDFLRHYAPGILPLSLEEFSQDFERHLTSAAAIIYLASTSIPAINVDQPWIEATCNIAPALEIAARGLQYNRDLRFIYLSSGGTVYGNGHDRPIKEASALRPISAYAYGKVAIEEGLRFLARSQGLRFSILRVSNPVGRWQTNPKQGILNVAMRAARSGEALNIFGGGEQVRDFIDADELAEAVVLATCRDNFDRETWNVGSGVGIRICDVLDLFEDLTGLPLIRVAAEARPIDVDYAVLDCTRIKMDLGWSARLPIHTMIEKVLTP